MTRAVLNTHIPALPTPHATAREGEDHTKLNNKTQFNRSEKGRSNHKKTAKRNERRKRHECKEQYITDGKSGLKALIAKQQAERMVAEGLSVKKVPSNENIVGLPIPPLPRKRATSKPAKHVVQIDKRVKKRFVCSPIILEQRRARAEFREVKRMFKKILKFALNQGKKYGHAFCIAVLDLFCVKMQSLVNES